VAVAGEADIRGATIVAAAAVNDAVVYSQDWGHNRTIDGVRVANPFKAS
jgi:predicted nucleic acid-binding protein